MPGPTIYEELQARGYTRREFLRLCAAVAAATGLQASPLAGADARGRAALVRGVVRMLQTTPRVPVIWLAFQDCAGCTEALTRSASPTLLELLFDRISLDYHETLGAAWGADLEAHRRQVMQDHAGEYLVVVEGSVPTGADGAYCTVCGRSAVEILAEVAAGARAVVATGSCASFGGIPGARPNPTAALGLQDILGGRTVINIPGCPAIPEVTTGSLVQVVLGETPELDALGRPLTFYGTTIHDACERQRFFRREQFAHGFDDEAARAGWCLFQLGCKGPTTHNACPTRLWGDLSFPVQSGHPCLGCSEPGFWDEDLYPRRFRAYVPIARSGG